MFKDPRSLLSKYGLHAKKYYSQNFLISSKVLKKMSSFAEGTVLEVGPGLGGLTWELSKRADKVIAVEKDRNFIPILENEYDWNNVQVINDDILTMAIPDFDICISSVPYSISSPLLFKLIELDYEYLVLLLQREFAQRLYSLKDPSRLTIMLNSYADAKPIMNVPSTAFHPRPKVNSQLVKIVPNRKFVIDDTYKIVVTSILTHKGKNVKNALLHSRESFNKDKEEMRALVKNMPYGEKRGRELDMFSIKEISNYISKIWKEIL